MSVEAGKSYVFSKSGSLVRALKPSAPYLGQPCWTVERTDGSSAGKQMLVPASALTPVVQ
jgi:hypothetical protein